MKNINRNILLLALILCLIVTILFILRNDPLDITGARYSPPPGKTHSTQDNWPMFRGSQNLSGIAEGSLPDSLSLKWKFKTEDSVISSPVVFDGIVYFGSLDAHVYAVDLQTGNKLWSFKTDDEIEADLKSKAEDIYKKWLN